MEKAVQLQNRRSGEIVLAELILDVPGSRVLSTQLEWNSYRLALPREITDGRNLPENHDWDWDYKFSSADSTEVRFFAIDHLGRIEGLMLLNAQPRPGHNESMGVRCVLYVEFLEAAPWNQPEYAGAAAQYKGIGFGLLLCAIERSMEAGCRGAIALHSLEAAELFYRRLGFDDFGFDALEGLRYFELSEEAALGLSLKGR